MSASASVRLVEAVARTSGVDPLRNAVDTDALHAHASDDVGSAPAMRFSYAGYRVHVRSATDIEVRGTVRNTGESTDG